MSQSRVPEWLHQLPANGLPAAEIAGERKRRRNSRSNIAAYLASFGFPSTLSNSRSVATTPDRNPKRQRQEQDDSSNLDSDLTPHPASAATGLGRLNLAGSRSRSQRDKSKSEIAAYLASFGFPSTLSTTRSVATTPDRNPKRQRQEQDDSSSLDSDLTPRPASTATGLGRLSPAGFRSRSQRDAESETSSRSPSSASRSPQAALVRLDNAPDGLGLRQLNVDAAPCDEAKTLLRRLRQVSNGVKILPDTHRQRILASPLCCRDAEDEEDWEFCFGSGAAAADTLPGRVPDIDQVEKVRRRAEACQNDGQDEAGWNANVHQVLLESIFHEPGLWTRGGDAFSFVPCTHARPHAGYLPDDARAQRVDFAVVEDLDPAGDDGAAAERIGAYRQLSNCTPTNSVNMTDFMPLRLRPILFAIETKPPHVQLDSKANLQMGVWHAAQWSFLTSACCHSIRARMARMAHDPSLSLNPGDVAKQAQERIDNLPFIPGIIVHGHVWSFVLSTRKDSRTTLWSQTVLGTTQSVQDIFKVAAGLREVAAWCRDEYMNWWNENVLAGFLEKASPS